MGATRDLALTELPIRGISINPTDGGNVTVAASDSGVIFINKYETNCTYTLPTVALAKGKIFYFYNAQKTATMTIAGGTTDKMMVQDDTTSDDAVIVAAVGTWGFVICDGTNYFFFTGMGTITSSG